MNPTTIPDFLMFLFLKEGTNDVQCALQAC